MKRREFLKVAGIGAAGLAVGATAGYVGMTLPLQSEIDKLDLKGHLNIFNWTYYLNRPQLNKWCSDHGITLIYDNFESGEELLAVIEATDVSGYDICVMTDGDIPYSVENEYLEPIDLDKIPNFELLPEEFRGLSYDPENEHTILYSYGTTGIGWNSDKVSEGITKWADIFDTTPGGILDTYKKKVTMMPDVTETLGAALLYLGYSPNSTDPDELDEAKDALIAQKAYLASYAGTEEFMAGLENEDFYISHGWNGDVGGVVYESSETEISLERSLENIQYTLPEEGAFAWYDNFIIPRGAPHPNAAHAFINFMLTPKVAAVNTMSVKYPFPTGRDLVPEALRNDPLIFTPPELLASLYSYASFTEEERLARSDIWTAVQAA
jgi:spermidine/putrescine-binding protein